MTFKVQKRQCATCIYRPDSTLDLKHLEAQIADSHLEGYFKGHRQCHHSNRACCRGFWEKHKDSFTMGQLAQRLNMVEFVDDDTLQTTAITRSKRNGKRAGSSSAGGESVGTAK